MDKKREKEISKKLSYVLRHRPDSIGIQLDKKGWTEIDLLLHKIDITKEELHYVVRNNAKQRFSFSADEKLIRANQGHSVKIALGLEPKTPPSILYHGTSEKNYQTILREGLSKMNRNHVHLSSEVQTAKEVGARHGKPLIFAIDTAQMHQPPNI